MTDPQPDPQQFEIDWWRNALAGRDPLAKLKSHRELVYSANHGLLNFVQIRLIELNWLIDEVERLRQVNKAGSQQVEELLGNLGTWEQLVQDRDAEVERLRETEERLHEAQITIGKLSHAMSEHEVERLRGLLGRLEWVWSHEHQDGSCPVCFEPKVLFNDDGTIRQGGHDPGCWLPKEIRPTSGEEQR